MIEKDDIESTMEDIEESAKKLIRNANTKELLHLIHGGGLGVRLNRGATPTVCLTQGEILNPKFEQDQVDGYLCGLVHEMPFGVWPVEQKRIEFFEWLHQNDIEQEGLVEIFEKFSGKALKRRIEKILLKNPGAIFVIKCELIEELFHVLVDYSDELMAQRVTDDEWMELVTDTL
jgi:hypothetical protein